MNSATEVMGTAWLVVAATDYEPDKPLAVFLDEPLANAWRDELAAYHATHPGYWGEDATEEESDRLFALQQAWRKAHPGGELAASCMEFVAIQLPLRGATTP